MSNTGEVRPFRVLLKPIISGEYRVVSYTIESAVGKHRFRFTADQQFKCTRNGQFDNPKQRAIIRDGMAVLTHNAVRTVFYADVDNTPDRHVQFFSAIHGW